MEHELSLLRGLRTAHRHRILRASWHSLAQQPLSCSFWFPRAKLPSQAPLPGTVAQHMTSACTLAGSGNPPKWGRHKEFSDSSWSVFMLQLLRVIVMFQLHKFYPDCYVCDASVEYVWDMLSKKTEVSSKINVSTSKGLWIPFLLLRTDLIFAALQNEKSRGVSVIFNCLFIKLNFLLVRFFFCLFKQHHILKVKKFNTPLYPFWCWLHQVCTVHISSKEFFVHSSVGPVTFAFLNYVIQPSVNPILKYLSFSHFWTQSIVSPSPSFCLLFYFLVALNFVAYDPSQLGTISCSWHSLSCCNYPFLYFVSNWVFLICRKFTLSHLGLLILLPTGRQAYVYDQKHREEKC